MSSPQPTKENGKRHAEKKYKVLWERLSEENSEHTKEVIDFFKEIEKTWRKLSPFFGEEVAYGRTDLALGENIKIKGFGLDFILLFVLFKRISEKFDKEFESYKRKLDKELKWFKENKKFLEMMVKEYIESSKFK